MVSIQDELVLFIGDAQPIDLDLFDPDGAVETTSGLNAAVFTISDGSTVILTRDTTAGDLSILSGKLTATLTSIEADALVAGNYIGQVAVRFTSDSKWKESELFPVRVRTAIAVPI